MQPLLVFDLDGTLIDSAPDIVTSVNKTLVKYGKHELDSETIIAHIGEGLIKLITDFFINDKLSPLEQTQVENDFVKTYESVMFEQTRPFPGVEAFLDSYKGPIGIITNKHEHLAKEIVIHLGLDRYPWLKIIGGDTLAEKKPSPLPLQTMMKLAGRDPSSTFMIGDGTPDMASARNAGVPAIAIGFGYTAMNILHQFQPAGLLESYSQLNDLLEKLTQGMPVS